MFTDSKPLAAVAWLALMLMTGFVLMAGRDVLIPLALSALIWQLINAIAAGYGKIGIGILSNTRLLRLLLAVLTIIVALSLVVNLITSNVRAASAVAMDYETNLQLMLPRIAGVLGISQPQSLAEILGHADLGAWIRSISSTLLSFAGSIGLIALYVSFMLLEQKMFDHKIDALFPAPGEAASIRTILGHIERRIEHYLWIKTAMSVATAVLSWIVLAAAGSNNANFWALIIFMLNYIPFVGPLIAVLFPALLTLVEFDSFGLFAAVAIGLAIIQFTLGTVLEPRLMGSSLNLSPMAIVVSLSVWGALWGIAGMFLCVPITVIVMIVCAHFAPTRRLAILLSATGRLDGNEFDPKPQQAPSLST